MCMFALTVSTAKPKNIKEAMADSAWIEAMQMKLSISFVRTTSLGTRLTTYFGKNVIQANSGFYGKTKRMKIPYDLCRYTAHKSFTIYQMDGENGISLWSIEGGTLYVAQPDGFVDPDHPDKLPSRKLYMD
ncbi:hypothetical protein Tco_0132249 [Tanacetum coccineum]